MSFHDHPAVLVFGGLVGCTTLVGTYFQVKPLAEPTTVAPIIVQLTPQQLAALQQPKSRAVAANAEPEPVATVQAQPDVAPVAAIDAQEAPRRVVVYESQPRADRVQVVEKPVQKTEVVSVRRVPEHTQTIIVVEKSQPSEQELNRQRDEQTQARMAADIEAMQAQLRQE